VAFLSSSEIVGQLAAGAAHFGVTRGDLVREQVADADQRLLLLAPLGFGRATAVSGAPHAWIDVRNKPNLEDDGAAVHVRHVARAGLVRIAAAEEARRTREVRARLPGLTQGLFESAEALFGAQPALAAEPDPKGWVGLLAPKAKAAELADWLLAQGAERVT